MNSTRHVIFIATWLGLSLVAPAASAGVNIKNGNFYTSYLDMRSSGEPFLSIDRTYNSTSVFVGLFGPGWNTQFETFLQVFPDGRLLIYENGGGSTTGFDPPTLDPEGFDAAVATLLLAARAASMPDYLKDPGQYRARLGRDADFRNAQWTKLVNLGELAPRALPIGARLSSSFDHYDQYVLRLAAGYARYSGSGKIEFFDDSGKLVRIAHADGYQIEFNHDASDRLSSVRDSLGRELRFTLNAEGRIIRVENSEGHRATYTYGPDGWLIKSHDAGDNVFHYTYDTLHNLVAVGYEDGTTREMRYEPYTSYTHSERTSDGNVQIYHYPPEEKLPGDGQRYSTIIEYRDERGALQKQNESTYYIRVRADGVSSSERIVRLVDGVTSDYTYDDHGRTMRVVRDGFPTDISYDTRGRVVEKRTPRRVTRLAYNHFGLSSILLEDPANSEEVARTTFEYGLEGQLMETIDSQGRSLTVTYHGNGQPEKVSWTVDGQTHYQNFGCPDYFDSDDLPSEP
ncbi:MAG: RHS repeat protein [Bradymonadaceae bacterium]|nr:RHS repeat protein [Lujinxingiaceae bacterium]